MADREHEQPSPDQPFAHEGELSIAQSTGSVEMTEAVSEGYDGLERQPILPKYEKHAELVRGWHQGALERADRLFNDIGLALHHEDVGQVPELIFRIIGSGEKMQERANEYLIKHPNVTPDQYDLKYFKGASGKKASGGASDGKHANLDTTPEIRRRQENKLAGEARKAVAPDLHENIINRRVFAEFGDTLETLAAQLEEKRSAQIRHAA